MKFVSVKQITMLGKAAVGLILTLGALLQVPAVSAPVFMAAKLHPHIAAIVGVVTTLTALLSNPQVQTILHIGPKDMIVAQDVKVDAGIITAASATLTQGPTPKV